MNKATTLFSAIKCCWFRYWHTCTSHPSSQSKHGDITPTRVSGVVFFKAINLVSQCATRLHQEVSCRSLARKLIWGPSDKTTDVRAAKKRRQSQGTRDGGWNFPGFSPLSKLMHRICGTPVVKRAHYGNLMLLVFSSHPAGILWLFLGRGCKVGGRPVARLWGRETPL